MFSNYKHLHPAIGYFSHLKSYRLKKIHLFLNFINLFILFLAALGLHCCTWAFSSCGERGLLFIAMHGLLTAVASLVAEHGL